MSGDSIEQNVTVSSGAQVSGDINLIGKVVNVITNPARWQDVVFNFLSAHRYFLIAAVILEMGLLAVYWPFKGLYQIPWWAWALAAGLLLGAGWALYTYLRFGDSISQRNARIRLGLATAGTAALIAVTGWQSARVIAPPTFAEADFGIAVAELEESGAFTGGRAALFTDQIYERLCRDIGADFDLEAGAAACTSTADESGRAIVVRRVGTIADGRTAHAFGRRIGAEIIIWGELFSTPQGNTTIRFEVLETLDQAVNPDYPVVMPVTMASADLFASVGEQDLAADPVAVKQLVSQQSVIISSFTQGLAAYLDQNYPLAVMHLERAGAASDENERPDLRQEGTALLKYYLGKAHHKLGRIAEGQQWLLEAQKANEDEPAIPLSLALGHGALGQPEARDAQLHKALQLLNDWLATHPRDPAALYDRGLVQQIRRQQAGATLDYQAALEADPDFFIAYLQLSQVLFEQGDLNAALDTLDEALALASEEGTNASWAYLIEGSIHEQAGQPAEAREAYQQAINADPQVEQMYHFYARFLENQGEMDAALANYEKMVQVSHNKGWAHGELGDFYRRRGLMEEALLAYRQAATAAEDDPALYTKLAGAHAALGEVEAAEEAFAEAIRQNEEIGNYFVYASYGNFLFQQGSLAEAATMYERSLEARPIDFPVLFNLGRTYEALGEPERAVDAYERIIELADYFPAEQVELAQERLSALADDGQ